MSSTHWELWNITRELREHGEGIDDSFVSDPSLWSNGLAYAGAAKPGFKTELWCSEITENLAQTAGGIVDTINQLPSSTESRTSVRHAWPLDLFRARLDHITGKRKIEAFELPSAKIFVLASAYTPPPGHPLLDSVPNILCVRMSKVPLSDESGASEQRTEMFLEPADNPATWQTEPGRKNYVLLAVTMPVESPTT